MPRRPRIHLANLPLHIVQRGHNRDACEDYHSYRHWLGEALKSTGCLLHAYVQMTNHVHLLLTPPVYLSLGQSEVERMEAYRALFRSELDADAIGDIRVALDQGQPLGNSRFLDSIERATGQRHEVKLRGRPRKQLADSKGTEDQLLIKI